MFLAISHILLDHGFVLYIHPADHGIINCRAQAGVFAALHIVAALPDNLFAGMVAVPYPPAQRRATFAAK